MDLRTYSKEMAERCRELARKLPEGRPPRSYLLQLAASYDEAAAGGATADAVAFAGAKPSLGGAGAEGAPPPAPEVGEGAVRPVEATAEEPTR